jgi:hypothetical protein
MLGGVLIAITKFPVEFRWIVQINPLYCIVATFMTIFLRGCDLGIGNSEFCKMTSLLGLGFHPFNHPGTACLIVLLWIIVVNAISFLLLKVQFTKRRVFVDRNATSETSFDKELLKKGYSFKTIDSSKSNRSLTLSKSNISTYIVENPNEVSQKEDDKNKENEVTSFPPVTSDEV